MEERQCCAVTGDILWQSGSASRREIKATEIVWILLSRSTAYPGTGPKRARA